MRFLGLGLEDRVRDAITLRLYREALAEASAAGAAVRGVSNGLPSSHSSGANSLLMYSLSAKRGGEETTNPSTRRRRCQTSHKRRRLRSPAALTRSPRPGRKCSLGRSRTGRRLSVI